MSPDHMRMLALPARAAMAAGQKLIDWRDGRLVEVDPQDHEADDDKRR